MRIFGLVLIFAMASCVVNPGNVGKAYSVQSPTPFDGYASRPGARVDIYVRNKFTQQWIFLKSAYASNSKLTFGGEDLYYWKTTVLLASDHNWPCYLQDDCSFGDGLVHYQVKEPGGRTETLFTFGPGGMQCTVGKVGEGLSLLAAYWQCKPDNFYEVQSYYWPFL